MQPGGFSLVELFLTAHPVVKAVMIGLLLASVWAWAIIVEKLMAFRRARREADRFEQMFWSGQSLDELYLGLSHGRTFSTASLFVAAMREWKRSVEGSIRALGGILYLGGTLIMAFNLWKTIRSGVPVSAQVPSVLVAEPAQ